MFPEYTWIVGLFIGAAIGSFLNVVIYRMPRGKSLSHPSYSYCPKCDHRLGILDLFPLLSWLFLGGKCRYCKVPIPPRYFYVELITGFIWAILWQQTMIDSDQWIKFLFFAPAMAALVAIVYIDLEFHLIPEQVNAFLSLCGLAYGGVLIAMKAPEAWTWGIPSALAGWLVGFGVLWGIAVFGRLLFGRTAMGEGDIKMARGIGAVLFPMLAMMSFGLAIAAGAVIGGAQAVIGARRRKARAQEAPSEEEVPVMVEGVFEGYSEGWVKIRVTETTQAQLAPMKQVAEFKVNEGSKFYRGEKQIEGAAFWEGLPSGEKIAINGRQKDGELRAEELGKDLAPLVGLFKSGLGYLLGIDIWGLFYIPLYKKWFGEDPFAVPEDLESFDAGDTMIPFGPYLALGAILAALLSKQLVQAWEIYLNSFGGSTTPGNIFFWGSVYQLG